MVILKSIRWPRKDIKRRKSFPLFEINKLVIKSLLNNYYYSYFNKLYFSSLFYNFPIKSSISKYQTYCMLQLQGRSIFREFKLSRHLVRFHAHTGNLIGYRKSSF